MSRNSSKASKAAARAFRQESSGSEPQPYEPEMVVLQSSSPTQRQRSPAQNSSGSGGMGESPTDSVSQSGTDAESLPKVPSEYSRELPPIPEGASAGADSSNMGSLVHDASAPSNPQTSFSVNSYNYNPAGNNNYNNNINIPRLHDGSLPLNLDYLQLNLDYSVDAADTPTEMGETA